MDGERLLHWFIYIMPKLEPGSVVVMDNGPYHSVRVEKHQEPAGTNRK
jgi:hypothetical protein